MGSSIYVFSNIDEYIKYYGSKIDEKQPINMSCLKVLDIYLKDSKVFFIVDSNNMIGRPDLTRSYAIIDQTMKNKIFTGDEILVKHGDLSYDPKKNHLEFMSKFLRKPKLWVNVDRYFGDKPKKKEKITAIVRFYDFELNRIILIQF